MSIRDAEPGDEAAWRSLWSQYLAFYDVTLTPEVTAATWARLMDPASPMKMRLAVVDGVPVGFAIHMHHPSTWVAGEDCYLEDLFLAPAARGKGLGRALIDDLIALARARGRLAMRSSVASREAVRIKSDSSVRSGRPYSASMADSRR